MSIKKTFLPLMIISFLFLSCTKTTTKDKPIKKSKMDSKKEVPPISERLYLKGDFNSFKNFNRFKYVGDHKYEAKIMLNNGSYRFVVRSKKNDLIFENINDSNKELTYNNFIDLKVTDKNSNITKFIYNNEHEARITFTLELDKSDLNKAKLSITKKNKNRRFEMPENKQSHLKWREKEAVINYEELKKGLRKYQHITTETLRDNNPEDGEISYSEIDGQSFLRTGNVMFDGLYALAIQEVRENSVDKITDGSFNKGKPVDYKAFETGEKWHYVWTRDTAYSVDLSLGYIDPIRSLNSLKYKISDKRTSVSDGIINGYELIQDTGSGGSWPISSDRVTWALGGYQVYKFLDEENRKSFLEKMYPSIINTLENDRVSLYDKEDGLYRGEQSFLDWREQTYPIWTQENTVHIGMSKSLSTNVAHYAAMNVGAELALLNNNKILHDKYITWARELKNSIDEGFWLDKKGLYSALKITELNDSISHKFDLLGLSLAIIYGVADKKKAESIMNNYPHSNAGPPVVFPQLQKINVYHNRGMWPFVTAYSILAAKKAHNDKVFNHNVLSMYRSSALNLSNMENYEYLSGQHTYSDQFNDEGPVINSRRQLWSVAGYISMVINSMFGIEMTKDDFKINPFLTKKLKEDLFPNSNKISLKLLNLKNKKINLDIVFPSNYQNTKDVFLVEKVFLNSKETNGIFKYTDLEDTINNIEVHLKNNVNFSDSKINISSINDYRNMNSTEMESIFAPKTPILKNISFENNELKIELDKNDEKNIVYNIYKNGELFDASVKDDIWINKEHNLIKKEDIITFSVEDGTLNSTGATISEKLKKKHLALWGEKDQEIVLDNIKSTRDGKHYLKVIYSNAHHSINTGITCVVKLVKLFDEENKLVSKQIVFMPHLKNWRTWGESSLVSLNLEKNKNYKVVISDYYNMTYFEHFSIYDANGGSSGPMNKCHIAEVKIEPLTDYYSIESEYISSGNRSHPTEPKTIIK